MKLFWQFLEPLLFGPSGAAIVMSKINSTMVGNSFIIIVCGISVRAFSVFLATLRQGFTNKEKILLGVSWISKGAVSAILDGIILANAQSLGKGYEKYAEEGIFI